MGAHVIENMAGSVLFRAYRWLFSRPSHPVAYNGRRVAHWFGSRSHPRLQKREPEASPPTDRRKEEFLAMLSHELRNPLAPIRNALHIMQMTHLDDPDLLEARDIIERQILQMARMIDDLLDVFRISDHQIILHKESLDLAALVRRTIEDHRRPLEQGRLTVTIEVPEGPVWITGDRTRLSQVVTNLLHNAVRFSNAGDQVVVRVVAQGGEQRATVSIRDTGVGIAAEMLPRVFDAFAQADQTLDRRLGGLGLGLTLVKALVELHEGEIRAASLGPGRGAEFSFWLPLTSQPATHVADTPRAAPMPKHLRVLIVEDNRDTAKSLGLLLTRYGHEVATAHSGVAGVQAAKEWLPDIVLCDLGLPEMDGYEVARVLRQDAAMAAARLIAISGYGCAEDCRRSQAAGFDLHLAKPVDPVELQRLLVDSK